MPSTKKIKKTHLLQFTKIKGVKEGKLEEKAWNEEQT